MTEVLIFSIGAIMFIATTWATLAFGLRRIHEIQIEDMAKSARFEGVKDNGFTETYVTRPTATAVAPVVR